MSGLKDPFEILADEITLIRRELGQLQRTSLNREEAEALNGALIDALTEMRQIAGGTPQAVQRVLRDDRTQMGETAVKAAASAAQRAVENVRSDLTRERERFATAAGEARREAWRYFGGFWVWLASVGAAGTVLGLVAAFWITGRGDAAQFGQYPGIYCASAGGQVVEKQDGSSFCAIWIKQPDKTGE